jgi:hypothetical protein
VSIPLKKHVNQATNHTPCPVAYLCFSLAGFLCFEDFLPLVAHDHNMIQMINANNIYSEGIAAAAAPAAAAALQQSMYELSSIKHQTGSRRKEAAPQCPRQHDSTVCLLVFSLIR